PTSRGEWLAESKRRLLERDAKFGADMDLAQEQYGAVLVQQIPRLIKLDGKFDPAEIIQKNLTTALDLAATRASVPSMRLVVFPEFWLTGPGGIGGIQRRVEDFESMAISYPGPVFDQISEFAQKFGVYVAFQNFETDQNFPRHVFNSAFLINDSGDLVHRYRKIQDADVWGLFPSTTPGSVLDRYLDVYGSEGLFPVAKTPIGNLANMICFDTMHPEVARGLTMAGAEVILHSSSEPHGANARKRWDNARVLRAFENTAIVLSAIDGGEYEDFGSNEMTFFRRGHTRAVNFDGQLLGLCDGPGPVAWRVELDLAALRRARRNPSAQIALWDDQSVYAAHYRGDVGMPGNLWNKDPLVNPYNGATKVRERVEDYVARGIYTAPSQRVLKAADNLPDTM
ncbi:MAG: putative amidohydrolase, partial [Halioglobus sp.]